MRQCGAVKSEGTVSKLEVLSVVFSVLYFVMRNHIHCYLRPSLGAACRQCDTWTQSCRNISLNSHPFFFPVEQDSGTESSQRLSSLGQT